MNEQLIDIRTPLAASPSARVEVGNDGIVHLLVGPLTLHLARDMCEELSTTLTRAMASLARLDPPVARRPQLVLVEESAR